MAGWQKLGNAARLANIRERLPRINQTPEELANLPEEQRQAIMLECQESVRGLCDKVIVYANGGITIEGLIEVKQITNVILDDDIHH